MCCIFFPTLLGPTAWTLSFNVCLRSCFNGTLTINEKYEVRWDGSAMGMRSCRGWSRRREAWPCHVRRSVCRRRPHVHTHARIKNETALTVNVLRWHSYSFQTRCGKSEEDEASDVFFILQVMSNFHLSQWRLSQTLPVDIDERCLVSDLTHLPRSYNTPRSLSKIKYLIIQTHCTSTASVTWQMTVLQYKLILANFFPFFMWYMQYNALKGDFSFGNEDSIDHFTCKSSYNPKYSVTKIILINN